MHQHNLIVLVLCLFAGFRLSAQINGKVADAGTGLPLEFATLTLLRPADSSLVMGTVTDMEGGFSLEAAPGTYLLKVEYISYQEVWLSDIRVNPGIITELGRIELSAAAEVLAEIEVRAEKSQMQMALDKKVFTGG
ncbi:MAG: carboxypeptidase-like regulatory domain-containing protein, partial [Saprospiraceae bacterium]|nr:carboxypeptidase-like regulatory domain-containing protein [Saprospiraceae bacterium]